jgi:hypothetical protein
MNIVYLYFFDSHGMSREKESLRDNEADLGGVRQVKPKWWRWLRTFVLLGAGMRSCRGYVVNVFIRRAYYLFAAGRLSLLFAASLGDDA